VLYSCAFAHRETSQPIAAELARSGARPGRREPVEVLRGPAGGEQLSFSIDSGAILGLVGPNGAGKTTTLRSIVGILPVTQGRIVICG
jgi:ABC-type uncharacterized transport system ATPase subunit